MDYQTHYDNLINRAKNRKLDIYTESHHIIPRCINGTDDKHNLVDLTPEEHFVAHQLLIKIYPNNSSIIFAAVMMGATRQNNKVYGWLKRKMSVIRKGIPTHIVPHSEQTKIKISISVKKSKTDEMNKRHSELMSGRKLSSEHKIKIREKSKLRINSPETRKKISISNKGKIISEEARLKSSLTQKGRKQELLICPFCNKEGGRSNMLRYHFDNCRNKI